MASLLFNPSFQRTDSELSPTGWQLSAPEGCDVEAFYCPEGHIRLESVGGRVEWRSRGTAVEEGERYGLRWRTQMDGEEPWHWTYLTRFTGVELCFLDAVGREVDVLGRRIRCLRTQGWVEAWMIFDAPLGVQKVEVAFVVDGAEGICMSMAVDHVALERLDESLYCPGGFGSLGCRVLDEETGEEVLARASVQGADGRFHVPRYAYAFLGGRFFHLTDPSLFELAVPEGQARVTVSRGLEYQDVSREVRVREGQWTDVTLTLPRVFDMPSEGWFGGDHHVHLFFHKNTVHPQMTPMEAMQIGRAEGLNYVAFQGEMSELLADMGRTVLRTEDFVGEVGLESVSDFYGHMCNLHITSPMADSEEGDAGFPMRLVSWPMNADVLEHQLGTGGASVYAHPLDKLSDAEDEMLGQIGDGNVLTTGRELPVDVALGYTAGFDLLCDETPGGVGVKLREYYRCLNLGFRLSLTASTDFYVDQARGVPGHNRTYVNARALDFAEIARGYQTGATFATNGPLVMFTVEGKKPGEEVQLDAPCPVRVSVRAFSKWGLDGAEILVNGEVVKGLCAGSDGGIRAECEVAVDRSCWVAVKAWGAEAEDIEPWHMSAADREYKEQFAHTSPVYLVVGGMPICGKREDALHFLRWVEAAEKAFDSRLAANCGNVEIVRERFSRAKAVFSKLAEQDC